MSRPSRLYKRLGIAEPLINFRTADVDYWDRATSVSIQRGSEGISGHTPSTITINTPEQIGLQGAWLNVRLTTSAADQLASRTYVSDPNAILHRFMGRMGGQAAHDHGDHKGRWVLTTIKGAAWSSVLARNPAFFTPAAGNSLTWAASQLFQPAWASQAQVTWLGNFDTWHAAGDPIDAPGLLSLLEERLYLVNDQRSGPLRLESYASIRARCEAAAINSWPLARHHCLAPTTWENPGGHRVEYRAQVRLEDGTTAQVTTGGTPSGTTLVEDIDWTELRSRDDQWHRVHGLRWDSQVNWRLPSLTVRLDHLISSPYEDHRRAAGMLLALDTGDPIPLAGDWPPALEGIHIVTGMDEQITPDAWTLTLSLVPYSALAGQNQIPINPRTWNQARLRTWDSATTTWNEGLTA